MATQTGSYDFKSTKAAKETAEKVATNFVATDSSGMMVYDGTGGTHTPTNPGANTSNVLIDSDSVDIRQGTDVLATFGTTTRVGKRNEANVTIDGTNGNVSINTPNLQTAIKLESEIYDPSEETYKGVIRMGGEYQNYDPPFIYGVTDGSNHIGMYANTDSNDYIAQSSMDARNTDADLQAVVSAEINNGNALSEISASNSNDSSNIRVFPELIMVQGYINSSDSLSLEGHNDPIGTVESSGDVTIDNIATGGSFKRTTCEVTVTAGVWIVNYYARFPANATGYRGMRLGYGTSSDITRSDIICQASNSSAVTTRLVGSITQRLATGRTYVLEVLQGSGSSMSGIIGGIVATRLV